MKPSITTKGPAIPIAFSSALPPERKAIDGSGFVKSSKFQQIELYLGWHAAIWAVIGIQLRYWMLTKADVFQALNSSPDPSAASAAVQAFLSSRAYSQSLSSSAAAAALRAHATSPKPVSEVQTKRTLRRQASTSSNGSIGGSLRGPAGRGLQRRASSGSMTERTFRDGSPVGGVGRRRSRDAPPVPAIPDTLPDLIASRQLASPEPPLVRSPSSMGVAGREVGLDRVEGQASHAPQVGGLASFAERDLDRTHDSGSVNFSYPIKGPGSPRLLPAGSGELKPGWGLVSPLVDDHDAVKGLSDGEVADIQYSVREAADRPVKKKKRATGKEIMQGSHLADGSMGGRLRGTAVNRANYDDTDGGYRPRTAKQDEHSALDTATTGTAVPTPTKKKKKKIIPMMEELGDPHDLNMEYPSSTTSHSDFDSTPETAESSRRSKRGRKGRTGGQPTKHLHVVRDHREHEEQEEQGMRGPAESSQRRLKGSCDTPETPGSGWVAPSTESGRSSQDYNEHDEHHSSLIAVSPAPTSVISRTKGSQSGLYPSSHDDAREDRPTSLGPSRTAHFSTVPLLSTDAGRVKHEPPPRAISPAKSAMKPSPSSRTGSPIGSLRGKGHSQRPGEVSDENSLRSEDGEVGYARGVPRGKKKPHVSFDEESVVVGHAVTPPTSPGSPGEKRGWYSQGRAQSEGEGTGETVSDIGIKPVPALPTFDSVRAKPRVDGREEVEKVTESVLGGGPAAGLGSSIGSQTGASSDRALGAIIVHDLASRGAPAPPVSEGIRPEVDQPLLGHPDPLPPLVTSVEGSGWASDSEVSVHNDDNVDPYVPVESRNENPSGRSANEKLPNGHDQDETSYVGANGTSRDFPQPILVEPTPTLSETVDREEWLKIPGGFPTSPGIETPEGQNVKDSAERHATDPTPVSLSVSEQGLEETHHRTGSSFVGGFATGLDSHTYEDESDSSGNSIYSDAAEDLSDLEGDGFGSIDAVVESPTPGNVVRLGMVGSIQGPATTGPNVIASQSGWPSRLLTEYRAELPSGEDMDKTQVYQQGSSAQRKQQMERATPLHPPLGTATPNTRRSSTKQPKSKRVSLRVNHRTESESDHPPGTAMEYRRPQESDASPVAITSIREPKRVRVSNSSSEGRIRSSVGDQPMRTSMRARPETPPSTNVSSDPGTQQPKGLLQKRHVRRSAFVQVATPEPSGIHHRSLPGRVASPPPPAASTPPKKAGGMAALRHTLSNESDSDSGSSFIRRPRATSTSPGVHMRRTMRSPPPEPEASSAVGSGGRPLSPSVSGERKPFSRGGTMRTTMRDSSVRTPSLRSSSPERTRSPIRFPGFGRSSKQKAAELQPVRSGFASRFSSSAKPVFRSRFADSSDEDEYISIPLTPVRGIPRRPGADSRESTDLSDSSDYDDKVVVRTPPPPIRKSRSREGNGPASSHLRHSGSGRNLSTSILQAEGPKPEQKADKKRFTLGPLGRHKKDATSKVRKSDMESAARRDTPLERSKLELQASKTMATASLPNGSGSAAGGRRNVLRHLGADSWPLRGRHHKDAGRELADGTAMQRSKSEGGGEASEGEISGAEEKELDVAAAGAANARAEDAQVNGNVGESEGESVVRKAGRSRRKRFPFLRRVFGLDER
ncbi:hypothetical protein GP486_005436 [Trichoglossum hirsutum]|uniref:Uncharacterized protein n=1 Tax=Trichoglossum hirsutum TaxID=265104 RepID=A0A9P8L9E6_9PEZI|nr:hypothetical protein GP486_005436 [Trichoglossum hirsutum]